MGSRGVPAGRRVRPAGLSIVAMTAAAAMLSPSFAHAELAPGELMAALDRSSKVDAALRGFYVVRGYKPLWIDGDAPGDAAEELYKLVATARFDGLNRRALQSDRLRDLLRKASRLDADPDELAKAELFLSRVFAAYVQGTRMPRDAGMTYQSNLLAPAVPSVNAALTAAAAAPSLERYVADMAWMHPFYNDLRDALAARELDREATELVQLNLERARAIPANPARRYVLVDAAGARLTMFENGKAVDSMKVVVGKPAASTPMIAGLLSSAVLNPYWNVPPDLVRERVAHNVNKRGLGYLKAGGYQPLSDWSDKPKVLDPRKINWRAVEAGTRELRVRQLPGKANFMGKVKYTFPNDQGIYLHDTPDKHLLQEEVRFASSGCVRLEDAARLGSWLFGKMPAPRKGAVEQVVPLEQPVPIYITYLTAAPEGERIVFRDDLYGRDRPQMAALARAGRRDSR
ncbi:MAG: L,D-transpeptidase family protein [Novosphingobium sp.]|nr:L,D-transpeptidase family protein [Novosphingobium sp.]